MSPLGFVHDSVEDHVFGTDTVFRHGDETGIDGHFKDVIVTTVIKTFVVFVWYGLWTIEDQIFDYFNVEFTVSAWISYVSYIYMYKIIRKLKTGSFHTFLLSCVNFHFLILFKGIGFFVGALVVFCQFQLILMLSKVQHSRIDNVNGSSLPLGFKIANVAILVLGAVATINSFRSVWYLLNSYFIPGE